MRNNLTSFHFTFSNIEREYKKTIEAGYEMITCEQFYYKKKSGLAPKTLVNRVDIDFSVKKAGRLGEIFKGLGIKASFFLRLHAPEYNPFSFENYRIIKRLVNDGHELGYHSEIVDQSAIWDEDAADCLRRDLDIMSNMFGISIKGVASHGGMTGLNNLDFWKKNKAGDFGLLYEAYDETPEFNLFNDSFYLSDSEWMRWKCYNKGKRVEGDHRSLAEHVEEGHPLLHLLIHPDTYFDSHFYENER